MFYLFTFVKTCFFFVRPELQYSVLKPYQSKTNDILKSCGTDNACAHSVSCQLPNSLRKKNNPIFFSIFNPDLLQVFIYQASCQSKFFVTFFFSKHKSVTCMDSNSDGFVHQKDNNSVTFMFMNAFSVSYVLLTNVLLFNLRFSILPFGGTLIHFCGCKTDKATNLSFPFTIVSAYTGDLWWL